MEFCSQNDLNKNKPKLTIIKEVPFAKKNEAASGNGQTEKQKRIADLKKQLLAPRALPNKKESGAPGPAKSGGGKNDDITDKFKRVMDWGTPRLVTKNR